MHTIFSFTLFFNKLRLSPPFCLSICSTLALSCLWAIWRALFPNWWHHYGRCVGVIR